MLEWVRINPKEAKKEFRFDIIMSNKFKLISILYLSLLGYLPLFADDQFISFDSIVHKNGEVEIKRIRNLSNYNVIVVLKKYNSKEDSKYDILPKGDTIITFNDCVQITYHAPKLGGIIVWKKEDVHAKTHDSHDSEVTDPKGNHQLQDSNVQTEISTLPSSKQEFAEAEKDIREDIREKVKDEKLQKKTQDKGQVINNNPKEDKNIDGNLSEKNDSIVIEQNAENSDVPSYQLLVDWWTHFNRKGELIGICASLLLMITILIAWYRRANKKSKTTSTTVTNNYSNVSPNTASDAIVIRRKTTSILRKQSLEDVQGNNAYFQIDCNEFCDDSTVRRIYIKNTCIKEIYLMYADDLRNPDNPKEDGCMVLGRWVHDKENNEYYVSLEQIVRPGDDAIFSEYELNFGSKIKIKVSEKLKKLRSETNLQYDLTCWVHSHPGLGIFFSNSDCNVQTQLKHPTHPNFLTAIVVDILTPQQELGIFTFKRDSTINSKADLKKMYSLEELYKWAVGSEKNSFKPENYYNTLSNVKSHTNDCYGIELSNGAIIDMDMLITEQKSGLAGMIHGFNSQQGEKTEFVTEKVTQEEIIPDSKLVGCFIIATHCSIPSTRKIIGEFLNKIRFVLVYTTTDDLLTSIPVINQDLCTDRDCYGENKFEDLKIWTRRKR